MGRRPPRRRLRRLAWPAALLLGVTGCAVPSAQSANLAERLNGSLQRGDRVAFVANFATDRVGQQWLDGLGGATANFTQADPTTLELRTTLPGDRREAAWTLHLDLDAGSGRISSLAPTADRPLWAFGAVAVTRAARGTVLSTGLDEAARRRWADRLDRAADEVAADQPAGMKGWTGGLVVEMPASGPAFQAISGEPADSASAVTTCSAGTPRVVVNPAILGQPDSWLQSTLVHEAVHVATDSACVPVGSALPWAVEGLAESVAARNDKGTASRNHDLVLAFLHDHRVPRELPTELADLTGYALAQLAVDQVQAKLGAEAGGLLDRAVHHSAEVTPAELRRVTGWYIAELSRLAGSG